MKGDSESLVTESEFFQSRGAGEKKKKNSLRES